ncbi:MAG: hypothetical protein H5U06_00255 [Candidatus Aminicenantes bacterium]|nr:hypothetical protein [Candidatus Aminicenantes bacterium]
MDKFEEKEYPLSPVSRKLVELIEKNAQELTRAYLQELKSHPRMPTYQSFPEQEVYERAYLVFSQLGRWISFELESDEMKKYWIELGKKRRLEGFALPEIFLSLCLLRKQLWNKIQSEGLLDNVLDLYQALELYNRIVTFFDRALYYAILGYFS